MQTARMSSTSSTHRIWLRTTPVGELRPRGIRACSDGRSKVDRCCRAGRPTYRARPTATFQQLAERWKVKVMPNHEESTQRNENSDIKALVAALGDDMVKDICTERVQDVIAGWKGTCSAKTIRNRIATFRLIWDKAKTWNHAAHTPYDGLDLPNYVRGEQPSFKPEDVTRIIAASASPYDVVWMLT